MDVIQPNQSPVMLNPSDWQGLLQMDRYSEKQKLEITAGEFESILMRQYLKEAMKPMIKGALNETGVSHEIYRGYYTDIMAHSLTKGNGIGISSVILSQLTINHKSKETDAS